MVVPPLVYVMGPSGAGKDAVIAFARARLDGGKPVVFAHRYATRPPGAGHPNEIALGEGELALRRARGLFAFEWRARGVSYGVGIEIRAWAERGLLVVVSGSREHFMAEACREPGILPVLVTASEAERALRLRARAREDEASIVGRLQRGNALMPSHPALVTIDNEGPLELAGTAFAELLARHAATG